MNYQYYSIQYFGKYMYFLIDNLFQLIGFLMYEDLLLLTIISVSLYHFRVRFSTQHK